jgi:2-polyprenyl-6-hydroxyphenyl methylase/3-demethylubiquinone-9 3-methyltransferase
MDLQRMQEKISAKESELHMPTLVAPDSLVNQPATPYDFGRCKLCAQPAAAPTYRLKKTTIYACADCGFHFIDALDTLPVAPLAAAQQNLDAKAIAYIESRLAASAAQQQVRLRQVQECLPLSGAHCLDLGAGAGLFASLLAAEGATVQGLEPQPVFCDFALRKFGLTFHPETVDAPYWQQDYAGAFDLITLWDVLEHVNFPVETLSQAVQLLKPGGYLLLDTPIRDALVYRLGEWSYRLSRGRKPFMLETLYSPQPFRHKQIFTQRQLRRLAEQCGLRVQRLELPRWSPRSQVTLVAQRV